MLKEEEIDSWNVIFPDCRIKQKDLTNPTMVFLVKALVKYLQKFGYDVNPPTQSFEFDLVSRDNRMFLINIVQHIDHILKMTDKTYSFTYFDLICPSTKKTSNMVRILLNYLYYFNMYKTQVYTEADEAIKVHDELLTRVQQEENENQQRKIKAQKIKEEIALYSEKLPKATAELKTLTERKLEQQEEIIKLEDQLKDVKENFEELQLQKRNLKKKIVPDTEAKELQIQLQKRKEKIAEQNELERSVKNSLKELSQSIKSMQNLHKDIEETKDMLPMRQLETLKENEKTCLETKNLTMVTQKSKTAFLEQVQLLQDDIKLLEESFKVQQKQFEEERISTNNNHNKIETAIHENNNQIEQLRHEEEHLDVLRDEQQEIKSYLSENINNLIHQFKK